jgi:hypothetical protein
VLRRSAAVRWAAPTAVDERFDPEDDAPFRSRVERRLPIEGRGFWVRRRRGNRDADANTAFESACPEFGPVDDLDATAFEPGPLDLAVWRRIRPTSATSAKSASSSSRRRGSAGTIVRLTRVMRSSIPAPTRVSTRISIASWSRRGPSASPLGCRAISVVSRRVASSSADETKVGSRPSIVSTRRDRMRVSWSNSPSGSPVIDPSGAQDSTV